MVEKIIENDTTFYDSIVSRGATAFGPSNLELRIFKEKPTMLYLVDGERKERNTLDFVFSIPAENNFNISILDTLNEMPKDDWYIKESSEGQDSIKIWIKDSIVYKKDTLLFVINYLRTDTLGGRTMTSDTTRYVFVDKEDKEKDKDKDKEKKKEKKKKEEDGELASDSLVNELPAINFLQIVTNTQDPISPRHQVAFEFKTPILPQGLDSLKLYEVVDDTLEYEKSFIIARDSIKLRRFNVDYEFLEGKSYKFKLDSCCLYNIYGEFNNSYVLSFKVNKKEEYGNININVFNVTCPTILQLFTPGGKSDNGKITIKPLREIKIFKDEYVSFDLVPKGDYMVRAIKDENNNNKWDTGLFLKGVKPEECYYLQTRLTVKANFDIEQDFNLNTSLLPMLKDDKEEKEEKN